MYRRTVLASSTVVVLAGCSEASAIIDGGYVDETLRDEQTAEFSAAEGEKLTVTVDVQETTDGAVSFQLAEIGEGPVIARSVSGSATYEVTIPADGNYVVTVTSGVAHVTVEPSE